MSQSSWNQSEVRTFVGLLRDQKKAYQLGNPVVSSCKVGEARTVQLWPAIGPSQFGPDVFPHQVSYWWQPHSGRPAQLRCGLPKHHTLHTGAKAESRRGAYRIIMSTAQINPVGCSWAKPIGAKRYFLLAIDESKFAPKAQEESGKGDVGDAQYREPWIFSPVWVWWFLGTEDMTVSGALLVTWSQDDHYVLFWFQFLFFTFLFSLLNFFAIFILYKCY